MSTRDRAPAGKVVDAVLHLLDRQVQDTNDLSVCVVDDIEISLPADGARIEPGTEAPVITNLLAGPAIATRIFGGKPPDERMERIRWADVGDVGTILRLRIDGEHLPVRWVENWLRDHVIARIPGGRHEPE